MLGALGIAIAIDKFLTAGCVSGKGTVLLTGAPVINVHHFSCEIVAEINCKIVEITSEITVNPRSQVKLFH